MKTIFFLLGLCLITVTRVQAQYAYTVATFNKRLGKIDTLCDKVYDVKIVNDSLTILAMGGYPPRQKYNIVATGYKVNMDFSTIKGKQVCIIGTFVTRKRVPQITATRPEQFTVDTLPKRRQ